jgi:hypothetical protein
MLRATLYERQTGKLRAHITGTVVEQLEAHVNDEFCYVLGEHDLSSKRMDLDSGQIVDGVVEDKLTWNDIRQRRDMLLDRSQWAVLDDSPLSAECQQAWSGYRSTLHRVTLDFAEPSAVIWPPKPELEFRDNG